MTVYSETRRQVVHITMAGFALPLGFMTWPQAAALASSALVFNLLLLPRIAPGILRVTDARSMRAGVLFYPLSVLLLILLFRERLDLAAAAWGIMAFGDGFATLAGRKFGGPRLSWNREKTWSGLIAFVIAASLGAVALSLWVAASMARSTVTLGADSSIVPLSAAVVIATIVAALAETLPIGLDDNLTVPAVAGTTLWFLSMLDWLGPLASLAFDLLLGAVVATPFAAAAWLAGSITFSGEKKKKKEDDKEEEKKDESSEGGGEDDWDSQDTEEMDLQDEDEDTGDGEDGEINEKPGGCGCRVGPAPSAPFAPLALLVGLALLRLRRQS